MAIVLTIGGVTKLYRKGSLNISTAANGRSTASFDVRSNDGTYRPALDAEVIITEGGTRIFGGVVDRPSEAGVLGDVTGDYEAIVTKISAVDFNQYAERRFMLKHGGFAAGTLKAALTTLTTYLSGYGVTLDAGQVTGPTFPDLTDKYEYARVSDILTDLMTLTGKYGDPYVWRIDHFKVLSAYQPATLAAPFNIIEGDTNTFGDITVEITRDQYANRVVLKVPAKTELNRVETFTGDGSTTSFTLQYTPTATRGYVTSASVYETLTTTDFPGTATWTLDPLTNIITRSTAPGVGDVVSMTFDGVFTGEATASDAGEIATFGLWEKVVTVESIPSDTTAQAIVDGELAKAIAIPKTIRYRTLESGILAGQQQSITLPLRDLSEVCIIAEVVIRDYGKDRLVRDVTATAGQTVKDGWRHVIKTWSGDLLGGKMAVAPVTSGQGVVVGSGAAAPPNRAVQYNRNGSFGGDDSFIWYEDENSVVCGDGASSITAADFESCQVFGYNNHITDP